MNSKNVYIVKIGDKFIVNPPSEECNKAEVTVTDIKVDFFIGSGEARISFSWQGLDNKEFKGYIENHMDHFKKNVIDCII